MSVRYSINGKDFKAFGVRVSSSKGFADTLKRKPVNQYDWAEYHGVSLDLDKPRFMEREIELQCFIEGENWQKLFDNFNLMVRNEFSKPGTQRLHIEPHGYKILPYEVFMMSDVVLNKTFKEGKMVALFTLKLIEPNPIKKVLKVNGPVVTLSYESETETEIFWGNGTKSVVPGNAAVSNKSLPEGSIIVIAGDIDSIKNMTTDAEVVWQKL